MTNSFTPKGLSTAKRNPHYSRYKRVRAGPLESQLFFVGCLRREKAPREFLHRNSGVAMTPGHALAFRNPYAGSEIIRRHAFPSDSL